MFYFLLADETTAGTNSSSKWVMTAILVVVLIGMLIMPYFSQRKKNKEYEAMINSIKVGDLVKTAGGIIGRIKKIIDKGEIKTVILETGSQTEKSYMEFDMNMIYCVLKSSKVESSDEEDDEKEETEEDKTEEKEPETAENQAQKPEELEQKQEEKTEEKSEEKTEKPKTSVKKPKTSKNASSKKSSKK